MDDIKESGQSTECLDLATSKTIDLAKTPLNFEKFKFLAKNKNLSPEERIGFPSDYRVGYEDAILNDIINKFLNLTRTGGKLLDIGCGASPLTQKILAAASAKSLHTTLVDSQEMLAHIPEQANVCKINGLFPQNMDEIRKISTSGFDYILCYSVLHYAFLDTNIFFFIDSLISLLNPGGIALIGDIPNISKRKRFFAAESGKLFHKQFMQTNEEPIVDIFKIEFNQIDDAVLAAIIQRTQTFGYDAYLIPQAPNLPMHNRRDDLVIRKP